MGAALINEGISRLRAQDAKGCVVLGDPDYYGRFGFLSGQALTYPGAPAQYFQSLALDGEPPIGEIAYHSGFGAT